MGQYNTAVLTTAGQSLLASVLGTEGTLTFSKFQTSSYQYASGTDLSALTSLQNVEQEILPSAGGIKDATTLYSSSTISNEGVTVEYDCNTVGLFATDGEDEVLFAVSTAIIPDVIPVDDGGAPSTYTYTMSIGVSSTANITVEVDDQGILRVSSIVDNLNSTSATAPLSANQGNVIAKDMVENILSGNTNTTGGILATGSYFINNTGQLCRVTTDIPVDGAITLNTNCVAVNVGGELTELNSNVGLVKCVNETETISDFNNCKIGCVSLLNSYTKQFNNAPTSAQTMWSVFTISSVAYLIQIAFMWGSPADFYIRGKSGGGWNAWRRVSTLEI